MNPYFSKIDVLMYYDYLNNANTYFEFGSGGSTYQAVKRSNIKTVYSVESDINWYNKVNTIINNNKLNFMLVDLKCMTNNWGNPGVNSKKEDWIKYSNSLRDLNKDDISKIDLILIDGRFRVACCLKSFDVIDDKCLIIFDDFLNRPQYHIVLNFFDIVNKTKDKRMVILKKKKCIGPSVEIIQKYEIIQE
jgi:protein O-GlcNAc transferase